MPDETGPISIEIEGEVLPLPGLAGSTGLLGPGGLPKATWSSFGRADRKLLRIYRDFRKWLAKAQRTGELALVVGYPGLNGSRAMRRELEEEYAQLLARHDALMKAGAGPADIADLRARMERISVEQVALADVTTHFYFPTTKPPRSLVGFGLGMLVFQFSGVLLALGVSFLLRSFLLRQRGDLLEQSSDAPVTELLGYVPSSSYVFWSLIGLFCLFWGIVVRRSYFRGVRSSLADNAIFAAYVRATGQ